MGFFLFFSLLGPDTYKWDLYQSKYRYCDKSFGILSHLDTDTPPQNLVSNHFHQGVHAQVLSIGYSLC